MDKVNILLCGYRNWARSTIADIYNNLDDEWDKSNVDVQDVISKEEFDNLFDKSNDGKRPSYDVIIFIGWSWMVPDRILKSAKCLCVHPSDLPKYRGGSPIQNQILNGVTESKVTLFEMTDKCDAGPIYYQEEFDLTGSMKRILHELSYVSTDLIIRYLAYLPRQGVPQDESKASLFSRRKPEQSKITANQLTSASSTYLYNKIRGLGHPYPNAYIVCADGKKLYITEAHIE